MGLKSKKRTQILGLVLGLAVVAGCSGESSSFPSVEGWTQPGEVLIYDADNLWEYINGAAELFVSYGVRSCHTTDLTSGDLTVTVDLYDMGTPLNAYGVFEREASGEPVDVAGAVAALVSPPYQALLLKGSTYAKVNVFDGELSMEAGRGLLEALAAGIPGPGTLPSEFGLLPSEGKIEGSEAYQAEAFLGLTELTDCVFAEYSGGASESWQGFVVVPEAAQGVWDALAAEWGSVEAGGAEVLFREVPYRGFVGVTWTDNGVFGVSGAADQGELLARLEEFTK